MEVGRNSRVTGANTQHSVHRMDSRGNMQVIVRDLDPPSSSSRRSQRTERVSPLSLWGVRPHADLWSVLALGQGQCGDPEMH